MNNQNILKKLIKIAELQQKTIIKLSQLNNDMEYLSNFIKNSIALFLVNNGVFAKENHTLEQIDQNNFKIMITLSPATKTPLSESVVDDVKAFLTTKFQSDPNLKSKSFDLDVKTTL